MARRSTKAGPARSRRRPDPSTRLQPFQALALPYDFASSAGVGTVDVLLALNDPTTGLAWAAADWALTGNPSNAYVIDSGGTFHSLTAASISTNGDIVFDQLTGIPAGVAHVIIPGIDPAFSTPVSDRIGTLWLSLTVT